MSDATHVIPRRDLIEHTVYDTADCVCGPRVEIHPRPNLPDLHLVVHHSLDGREQHEETR